MSREWIFVIVLLLLAFALRTLGLTHIPPGLHNDEVVEIKLTESVANGRIGIFFPEDTGHETLYYYFAAPFLHIFGNTIFAMRLPTVFLSMISMCVVWALTRRLFGRVAALTALAGFAVTFWTVAFGRIISHVCMEVPLAALSAYCFWRARSFSGWKAIALWAMSGLWLGLSINTYTAARALPAIFVAFGAYIIVVHQAEWHQWWREIAIVLIMTAIVVTPLALYLIRHPTADQLDFFDINRPLVELRKGNLQPVIKTSLRTLGMFAFVGDPLPYFDIPGRPVFEPVGALLLAAGLLIALWRWRQPKYAFVVLWFFLSLTPGMLSQPAPNYTRTLGVQVVLFAFPGIAVTSLLARKRNAILHSALTLLFVGNLAWTVYSYFIVWPNLESVRFWHQSDLKAATDYLQDDPDASPVAVCVPDRLLNERDPWWKPAWQHMRYLLHRPELSVRYYNCTDAMILIAAPARYAFPGTANADELSQFPIYRHFLSSAHTELETLPDRSGIIVHSEHIPTLERYLTNVAAESKVSWPSETDEPEQPAWRPPLTFGDQVKFMGYTLSASVLEPGESFDLAAYWQVNETAAPGLVQFTHVLADDGTIITQQDRLALTSRNLLPDDIFVQIHHLTLPSDVAKGEYALTMGLYTPSDGVRLGITKAGQSLGDRLWLEPITVDK